MVYMKKIYLLSLLLIIVVFACDEGGTNPENSTPGQQTPGTAPAGVSITLNGADYISSDTCFFKDFQINNDKACYISIQNSGTATLDVQNVALSGADTAKFILSNPGFSPSINPGQSASFHITFSPQSHGTYTAQLNVNFTNGTYQMNLNGSTMGVLELTVLSNGTPIQGAVILANSSAAGVSDGSGKFITNLPGGTQFIYKAIETNINLGGASYVTITQATQAVTINIEDKHNNGSLYKIISTSTNWHDALQYCRDNYPGGNLIAITSDAEYNFIKDSFIPSSSGRYWLGLNDEAASGSREWATGETVTPITVTITDDNTDQRYFYYDSSGAKFWGDDYGYKSYAFICEY